MQKGFTCQQLFVAWEMERLDHSIPDPQQQEFVNAIPTVDMITDSRLIHMAHTIPSRGYNPKVMFLNCLLDPQFLT